MPQVVWVHPLDLHGGTGGSERRAEPLAGGLSSSQRTYRRPIPEPSCFIARLSRGRLHSTVFGCVRAVALRSHFSSVESATIRQIYVRNVEVGGSSPLTSTVYFGFACFFAYGQGADLRVLCWAPPSSTGLSTEFIDGLSKLP